LQGESSKGNKSPLLLRNKDGTSVKKVFSQLMSPNYGKHFENTKVVFPINEPVEDSIGNLTEKKKSENEEALLSNQTLPT
jgi:hypothetical protein